MIFVPGLATLAALGWAVVAATTCPLERTGGWGSLGSLPGEFNFAHHLGVSAATGDVYVGDLLNHRVQRFSAAGTWLGQWAVPGVDGVGVAPDGSVYVTGNDRLTKYTATGAFLLGWGMTGGGPGQFDFPVDVAVDASGFVYVCDAGNHRIQKFDASGLFVGQWGSDAMQPGQLVFPFGIAIDALGEVYVADANTHRIEVFTADGVHVRGFGTMGSGDGQFQSPGKPAFDADGNLLVPDGGNSRLQMYTRTGTYLCSWGSLGQGPDQFFHPTAVVGTGQDFYVMDKDNHRIVRLDRTPTAVESRSWSQAKVLWR